MNYRSHAKACCKTNSQPSFDRFLKSSSDCLLQHSYTHLIFYFTRPKMLLFLATADMHKIGAKT